MLYQGRLFRPPSEAWSAILQATVGCSHQGCSFCAMYREKRFEIRPLEEILSSLEVLSTRARGAHRLFVADGDALVMPMDHWRGILGRASEVFPSLERVSTYATTQNLLEKSLEELRELKERGLTLLYLGPESGDDETLKLLGKGVCAAQHIEAAEKAHAAGMTLSVIVLLGAGGVARSQAHAEATARLITEMNPRYLAALTLTLVEGTPLSRRVERGEVRLPLELGMLEELRVILAQANPTRALFRTNHASNYLSLAGSLPDDREALLARLDEALKGRVVLRPEWARGL